MTCPRPLDVNAEYLQNVFWHLRVNYCSLADPFGGDPFQQNDPFKDPFANSDPFGESSSSQFKVKQNILEIQAVLTRKNMFLHIHTNLAWQMIALKLVPSVENQSRIQFYFRSRNASVFSCSCHYHSIILTRYILKCVEIIISLFF